MTAVWSRVRAAFSWCQAPGIVWVSTGVFFLAGVARILNHAMWRDELQAWLVASQIPSLSQFGSALSYNGHPPLWYFCLWLISRFTDAYECMQIFHVFCTSVAVWFVLAKSPFKPLEKILICLGYYFLFEYLLFSRNYALGLIFLFAFCSAYQWFRERPVWAGVFAALACQTNAYAAFIIGILLAGMLVERTFFAPSKETRLRQFTHGAFASLIYLVGLYIAGKTAAPPVDSVWAGLEASAWSWHRFVESTRFIWAGFFPVIFLLKKSTGLLSWDRVLPIWQPLLSGWLGWSMWLFFRRDRLSLWMYSTALFVLFGFTYLQHLGDVRHSGHTFILFLCLLWVYLVRKPREAEAVMEKRFESYFFRTMLVLQVIFGVGATIYTDIVPVSAAKETALYLQEHKLDQEIIVAHEDFVATPVAGYLKRKFYYPSHAAYGDAAIWTRAWDARRKALTPAKIIEDAQRLGKEAPEKQVILLVNSPLDENALPIERLAIFNRGLVPNEKYIIYRLKK